MHAYVGFFMLLMACVKNCSWPTARGKGIDGMTFGRPFLVKQLWRFFSSYSMDWTSLSLSLFFPPVHIGRWLYDLAWKGCPEVTFISLALEKNHHKCNPWCTEFSWGIGDSQYEVLPSIPHPSIHPPFIKCLLNFRNYVCVLYII